MLQWFSPMMNFTRSNWAQLSANDDCYDGCARSVSLSQTELHDSKLEFSTAIKCFTDDSNDEVVIF